MLSVRRRPSHWNLPACLRVDMLRARNFSRSLDEVTLTITREIAPVHAKPTGFTAVRWSQGSTPRKYAAHDTYSSIFPVHKLKLTKDKLNWPRTAARNDGCDLADLGVTWLTWLAVSCTRDGADWPKVVAVGAQQPISDFFYFIQMRDTLSTNGEHLRAAEVKSFPAIPKSRRSVNGDQNGANLKKWSVLLVCTIPRPVCKWTILSEYEGRTAESRPEPHSGKGRDESGHARIPGVVLSFPHATSSSTISCLCPVLSHCFLRSSEGWVELLLLALLFITLSVVIFWRKKSRSWSDAEKKKTPRFSLDDWLIQTCAY